MTTAALGPIGNALTVFLPALPVLLILLKITCVLLAALAATLAMSRASAGSRHLIWLVAVGALLVLPPLALWGPLPLRVLPEALSPAAAPASTQSAAGAELKLSTGVAGPVVGGPESGTATPLQSTPAASLSLASTVLVIWAVVALGLIGRLVYGAWSVRRIVRQARKLEHPDWQTPLYQIADRLGLDGAPQLLQSTEVKMPFAAGLLTSWIVLPADSEQWTAERRSAVLIHELGHVRRRDLIGHTLGRIVCALYWFHPLVWTAARRLRAESERACDDLALVFGARPSDYAEHLLDIVTCVRDHNTPAIALALAHRKEFEGRMLAVLNPELRRRGPTRFETASLVGSLAVLALLVGAAAPVARAPAVQHSPAPREPEGRVITLDSSRPPAVAPVAPKRPAAPVAHAAAPSHSEAAPEQSDSGRAAALARSLRTDSNVEVRRVAAWGLSRYARTDVGVDALVAAVGGDADASVREMATWALAGARRNGAASAALIKAMRQDKDPKVRETAVWAAGSVGDPSVVDALASALADTDPDVRENAAWAIGSASPDRAPAALVRALTDKDRDVRLSVAWALYSIRDPETTNAIDAAFRHETDSDVQHGLIRALGEMGDRAIDALQQLVSSPDPAIRTVAVTALAGGGASGPWPWPRPQPRPFP